MNNPPLLCMAVPTVYISLVSQAAATSLTIYNQDFAVVRDSLRLELKAGIGEVTYDGATALLEPDSVILRSAHGEPVRLLEQNYRNDPVSRGLLLSLFEGQTISFFVHEPNKPDRVVEGKIIRSGYGGSGEASEPVIEVDGKVRFGLPGEPVFPTLGDDTILKPQLVWKIESDTEAAVDAEVGYITGGLGWSASYNLVVPEHGDTAQIVGWITMENHSGRQFDDARIKLMAGDVAKIQQPERRSMMARALAFDEAAPDVSEKTFDEYHLYTLGRPTTLRDRETKQVEFLRAKGVKMKTRFLYDGTDQAWRSWAAGAYARPLLDESLGMQSSRGKVAVVREIANTKDNALGIPLPAGRFRFYREDGDSIEFTGEAAIDHSPADETLKLETGYAFDLVAERKRTDFRVDSANRRAEETFTIELRNRKKEAVTIRVVEHPFRWANWKIEDSTHDFKKVSHDEIHFDITLEPGAADKLVYTTIYSW